MRMNTGGGMGLAGKICTRIAYKKRWFRVKSIYLKCIVFVVLTSILSTFS